MMIKNIDEIVNVLLTEESEDEEEEKKESIWAVSPPKSDTAFKPSKILPALLWIEEQLRNDWWNHMYFFKHFMFLVSIFDDNVVEKKFYPILSQNLWSGNRMQ